MWILLLCIILWGASTFLNRLSVQQMPPSLMQVIVGIIYITYIPIALRIQGAVNPLTYKWSVNSILLTSFATVFSIIANILLYFYVKNNDKNMAAITVISLYPIVTIFLSFVFLHEGLSLIKILGILIMIIGVFLISI